MAVEIAVVGAGVIGLTTAYQLSRDPLYSVKVITRCLPDDPHLEYTSQYAGANWRSVCSNDDYTMIAVEEATLSHFRELCKSHPELVNECMSFDYFDSRVPDTNDQRKIRQTDVGGGELPWFERICPKFKLISKDELPEKAEFGVAFDTVTINAPEYVKWLYKECLERNVTFDLRDIKKFSEIEAKFRIVINCSGLGARELCDDLDVYPTRGQTVLVKNTTGLRDTLSRVGQHHLSYLIPRPGDAGLIIGGCQQPNNWSYEPDEELAKTMLDWALTLYPGVFPNGHTFEIIKHNVGLRPSRKGGVRLEAEHLPDRTIIHGYGIGGWGYQSSWGIGQRLIALVEQALVMPEETDSLVFTRPTALAKVKKAQDLWNTRTPADVVKAYTEHSTWRNRTAFLTGHAEIRAFLEAKWSREHNYRLRKELFAFSGNRIAVEFYYEYSQTPDTGSQWFRCYGIEHWVFANDGRMRSRQMSGNEMKISPDERWFLHDQVDDVIIPSGHMSH